MFKMAAMQRAEENVPAKNFGCIQIAAVCRECPAEGVWRQTVGRARRLIGQCECVLGTAICQPKSGPLSPIDNPVCYSLSKGSGQSPTTTQDYQPKLNGEKPTIHTTNRPTDRPL
jgi:hypothetical protein